MQSDFIDVFGVYFFAEKQQKCYVKVRIVLVL